MRTKFTRCRYNKQADESEGSKLGNYNKIFPEPLCDFVQQQRLVRSLAFSSVSSSLGQFSFPSKCSLFRK